MLKYGGAVRTKSTAESYGCASTKKRAPASVPPVFQTGVRLAEAPAATVENGNVPSVVTRMLSAGKISHFTEPPTRPPSVFVTCQVILTADLPPWTVLCAVDAIARTAAAAHRGL